MTKIIILPDMKLDEFYQCTLDYLYRKYHSYPSLEPGDSSKVPFSPKVEKGDTSERPNGKTVH